MAGNTLTLLDNPYLGGAALHFYLAPAGGIRHRVQVAVHGHHAVPGHPAFQRQDVRERADRQGLQGRTLRLEGGVDHLTGGGVGAPVRYLMTPAVKLPVQILQVVELPGQEEVLTDITKRALPPCLWSWPGRAGRLWVESRSGPPGPVGWDDR